MVEQATRPRRIGASEDLGLCRDCGAEPAEQFGTPLQAHQWIAVARLEMVAQRIDRQRFQHLASARNGESGRAENAPPANIARLASANPSDRPTSIPVAASR